MTTASSLSLRDVLLSADPGFASGQRDETGTIQVRMNNVSRDGHLDLSKPLRLPTDLKKSKKYSLEPGDILFNITNSPELVGKTTMFAGFNESVLFSNHFLRIRVNSRKVMPEYLKFFLLWHFKNRTFFHMATQWVNQATVRKDDLLDLPISLPSLGTQASSTQRLERADRLRRLRRHALTLSDEYLQNVFLEMFGDPEINSKGWDLCTLGDAGRLDRGISKHRPRNDPRLLGGDYPLIQTGEVSNASGFIYDYTQSYSELGLKQSKMWPAGTLCITIAANIGKTAILTFPACFPDSIVGFIPKDKEMTTEFVRYWFVEIQKRLEDSAPESAQKNINLEILRTLIVPKPPFEMQQRFAHISHKHERLRRMQIEALRQADQLYETLLEEAFGS